jgi:hypothetical protein
MDYAYYPDHIDPVKFTVTDNTNNEWRGVITLTKEGKWLSRTILRRYSWPITRPGASFNSPKCGRDGSLLRFQFGY